MSTVRLTVIRHSQAMPAAQGESDKRRILSEEGIDIAQKRRQTCRDLFDLGITSDRVRAIQTMAIVGGFTHGGPKALYYSELVIPETIEDEELLIKMYKRLGSKTLGEYLFLGSDEEVSALRRFGRRGWSIIERAMKMHGAKNVLVVNHEIFAPMIVDVGFHKNRSLAFTGSTDPLLGLRWDSCDGVEVTLENGKFLSIKALPTVA